MHGAPTDNKMRRPALLALAALVLAPATHAQLLPAFGTDRGGTVGFQFLKLPSDARALGMGNAGVTSATDASALYWNPALAAQASGVQVAAGRANYYDGPLFTTNFAGVTAPVGGVTVGLSLQTLDSGPMDVTTSSTRRAPARRSALWTWRRARASPSSSPTCSPTA